MLKDSSYKATKKIYLFFLFSSVASFFYAIVKQRYNGDFLGIQVELSYTILTFNLILSLIPFFLIWIIYKKYKKKTKSGSVAIPLKFFGQFLFLLIVWNIIVTIIYGVGVIAAPAYEAPPFIKIIIQILNRFNYSYGFFLYILLTPKKNKTQFYLLFLIIVLSFLIAGLGVFFYL